jgi:hypothetical protein
MRLKNVLATCAVAAGLGVSAPVVMAAPNAPVAAQHTERASTVATRSTPVADDAARYAAMEQQQPKAADFKGGDTVVIAMSSGAVIVAVVLLVLLL